MVDHAMPAYVSHWQTWDCFWLSSTLLLVPSLLDLPLGGLPRFTAMPLVHVAIENTLLRSGIKTLEAIPVLSHNCGTHQ